MSRAGARRFWILTFVRMTAAVINPLFGMRQRFKRFP